MSENKVNMSVRTVYVNSHIYLRKDDVVGLLIELASSKETDTRNRILEAAAALNRDPEWHSSLDVSGN